MVKHLCLAATGFILAAAAPGTLRAQALTGEYTIGEGCDYASFTAAVDALTKNGVAGPVTFNVSPGEYDEQISISSIPGASATNIVRFIGNEDDPESTALTFSSMNSNGYIAEINGGSFIEFNSLKFGLDVVETAFSIVNITNGASNISFNGCMFQSEFNLNGVNYGKRCTSIDISSQVTENITISDCNFDGAYTHIHATEAGKLTFTGNVFTGAPWAIEAVNVNTISITDNEFSYTAEFNEYNFVNSYAIQATRLSGNNEILRNKIEYTGGANSELDSAEAMGISCGTNTGATLLVANNTGKIRNVASGSTCFLAFNSNYGTINAVFNTGDVYSTALPYAKKSRTCAVFFKNEFVAGTINLHNNILYNGGPGYAVWQQYSVPNCKLNASNNFYCPTETFGLSGYFHSGTTYTYADWASKGHSDELFGEIEFSEEAFLKPTAESFDKLAAKGVPFNLVSEDVEGTPRNSATPTIGAYEYVQPAPTPLAGEYTIGEGCDYTSFTAAINDLNELGVAGAVTFYVQDGTYTEAIRLGHISGVSEANTITFSGNEDDNAAVILTSDYCPNDPDYNYNYMNIRGVVTMDQADYISFENMSINTVVGGPYRNIVIRNGSDHLSFTNCILSAPFNTVNYMGTMYATVRVIGSNDRDASCQPNNDLRFIACTFEGGNENIRINEDQWANNLTIENCSFIGTATNPITIQRTSNIAIKNNTFTYNSVEVTKNNFYNYEGLLLTYPTGKIEISGNKFDADVKAINNSIGRQLAGNTAIRISALSGEVLIHNNSANLTNAGSSDTEFIYFENIGCKATVAYNTANINATYDDTDRVSAIRFEKVSSDVLVANNIFMNSGNGYIYRHGAINGVEFKTNAYNAHHAPATLSRAAATAFSSVNSTATDYSTWSTTNAHNENPLFLDVEFDEEGRPTEEHHNLLAFKGTPVDGVSTDAEGNMRNELYPTIGAHENTTLVSVDANEIFSTACITTDGDALVLRGLNGVEINVYTTSGVLVSTFTADSDIYTCRLGLDKGVYIVNAEKISSKVIF